MIVEFRPKKNSRLSPAFLPGFFFFLFLLLVLPVWGRTGGEAESPPSSRFSFVLKGGAAHTESRGAAADLAVGLRMDLSRKVAVGLGVGYLGDSDTHHASGHPTGGSRGMGGGATGRMMTGMSGSFSGHTHDFDALSILLDVSYILPLSTRAAAFLVVGGGWYRGSFRDISIQRRSAFGPHVGAGVDFRVDQGVTLLVEGLYRHVLLEGFESELHPGYAEGIQGQDRQEGFWQFQHDMEEWSFYSKQEVHEITGMDGSFFDISLNGFALRGGVSFRF